MQKRNRPSSDTECFVLLCRGPAKESELGLSRVFCARPRGNGLAGSFAGIRFAACGWWTKDYIEEDRLEGF